MYLQTVTILLIVFQVNISFYRNSGVLSRSANICGFNGIDFICCYGWLRDSQGECVIPHCPQGCGAYGKCIRPDTCLCSNGYVSYICPKDPTNPEQQNGEISDDPSVLPGASGASRRCPNDCNGRGECLQGACKCTAGYEGPACEVAAKGTCYLAIKRGLCANSIESMLLTREECCGAFRVAWGNPCNRCTATYCSQGYKFVDRKCVDIDECQFPGICLGGTCRNLIGSYECACPKDYFYEKESGKCVYKPDVCHKQPDICGEGGTCMDRPDGTYYCKCHPGYVPQQGTDQKCVPRTVYSFNMCQLYKGYVCENGKCIPNGASYMCHCNTGYVESSDRKSCKRAIDICATNKGLLCPNGKCFTQGSDFYCQCNAGYMLSHDRKSCLSHCDMYPALCPNGRCIPTTSGYECECLPGYTLIGDGKACQSTSWAALTPRRVTGAKMLLKPNEEHSQNDEGSQPTGIQQGTPSETKFDGFCSIPLYRKRCQGGDCVERTATYQCLCLAGYTLAPSGMSCEKNPELISFNEKQNDVAVSQVKKPVLNFCDKFGGDLCPHGRCVESGSAYQCVCNSGFRQSKDGKSCMDINECTEKIPAVCGSGTCINTLGGFTCNCAKGFTLQDVAGQKQCLDMNECESLPNVCHHGICVNLPGSYECNCLPGFTKSYSGKECVSASALSPVGVGSPFIDNVKSCYECSFGCHNGLMTVTNTTRHRVECVCPMNTSHFEKSGVCGNLKMIKKVKVELVDEQAPKPSFAYSSSLVPVGKSSISDLLHPTGKNDKKILKEEISFELKNDVTVDEFVSSLKEMNVHVKREKCSRLNLFGSTYVYCTFYYSV
jgi:hypothetical protein